MSKSICLCVYNEPFWTKGLLYSQNILPLINLRDKYNKEYSILIYSFTSLFDLLFRYKKIRSAEKELLNNRVSIRHFPIVFVKTKFLIFKFYLFPFLLMNMLSYFLIISLKDLIVKNNIIYHLRSYPMSACFRILYFGKNKFIFDPRTDFITEMRNMKSWNQDSITDKLWLKLEKSLLERSSHSIFISKPMRDDILLRTKVVFDQFKYIVVYNTINISDYSKCRYNNLSFLKQKWVFLFTGSLGHWNNLNVYLDFFSEIKKFQQNSEFIIVTNSRRDLIQTIVNEGKYSNITKSIDIIINPSYEILPQIYERANIGLQLMSEPDSRIGVKFFEYLASGIMPITNSNVRGASEICRTHSLGYVIKDYNRISSNDIKNIGIALNNFPYILGKSGLLDLFDLHKSYIYLNQIYK